MTELVTEGGGWNAPRETLRTRVTSNDARTKIVSAP